YVAVCMPLRHGELCSSRNNVNIVLFIHALSSVPCIVILSTIFGSASLKFYTQFQLCAVEFLFIYLWQQHLRSAISQFYFLIMLITVVISYVKIMKVAKAASGEDKQSSRKGLRTVALHGFQLLLCLIQLWCSFIEAALLQIDVVVFYHVRYFNYILFYLVPKFLSPLIYGLRDEVFFHALKKYVSFGLYKGKLFFVPCETLQRLHVRSPNPAYLFPHLLSTSAPRCTCLRFVSDQEFCLSVLGFCLPSWYLQTTMSFQEVFSKARGHSLPLHQPYDSTIELLSRVVLRQQEGRLLEALHRLCHRLKRSGDHTTILTVVARFSKISHFIPLPKLVNMCADYMASLLTGCQTEAPVHLTVREEFCRNIGASASPSSGFHCFHYFRPGKRDFLSIRGGIHPPLLPKLGPGQVLTPLGSRTVFTATNRCQLPDPPSLPGGTKGMAVHPNLPLGLRTVALHGFQLLLCLIQLWCPFIESALFHIDFVVFNNVRYFNYIVFYLTPRCLSPLIYGLRDEIFFHALKSYLSFGLYKGNLI
ncbi:uncharacterized protein LOC115053125, partial [Echeneis naucrates]|uniref:uncharacterized protein LOC115053125 n=1 Tax=Echeneis naucrates TaxID=173247 RepID=UPI00111467DC